MIVGSLGVAAPAAEAAGTTTWVSHGNDGDSSAYSAPAISADGRYVVFYSTATDLIGSDGETAARLARSDGNQVGDIFLHDRQTGDTERVSVSSAGTEANADSLSGAAISGDGRYVVFGSRASNLVPDDTNGVMDIFVRDRLNGATERVSGPSGGGQANAESNGGLSPPAISADGRYVAFGSSASNLVGNDENGTEDVFVRDRQAGTTTRVSVASDGSEANPPVCMSGPCPIAGAAPSISADGRYVAFWSDASDLAADGNSGPDVFVHDRQTATTTNVSPSAEGGSNNPSISADGRYVAFWSRAADLVPEDGNGVADIFVRDREAGVTARASVSSDGAPADKTSYDAAISPDGRYVAFTSDAANLVPSDGNPADDTFLHDRQTGSTTLVSVGSDGGHATESAGLETPSVTSGGRDVVFTAVDASPLLGNGDYSNDVYVHTSSTSTLSVTRTGSGAGRVTSSPPGIDCGSDCSEDYDASTSVTLEAAPSAGSAFEGWSGACSGEEACELTMEEARSVTATFSTTDAADPPAPDVPVALRLPTPSTAGVTGDAADATGDAADALPAAPVNACFTHWHERTHRHVTPHRHERVTLHRHVSRHRHRHVFIHVHLRIHRHRGGRRHWHLTRHRHVQVTNHTHVKMHRHVKVTNHNHVRLHRHRDRHVHCGAAAAGALEEACKRVVPDPLHAICRLNRREVAFCGAHPARAEDCVRFFGDAAKAFKLTEHLFTGERGRSDATQANGFQHAYWVALMVNSLSRGERWMAIEFARRHENRRYASRDDEVRAESRMDLNNNDFGYQYGLRRADSTDDQDMCEAMFAATKRGHRTTYRALSREGALPGRPILWLRDGHVRPEPGRGCGPA